MLQHAASANFYLIIIFLGILMMASGSRTKPIPHLNCDYRLLGLVAIVVGVSLILHRLGI